MKTFVALLMSFCLSVHASPRRPVADDFAQRLVGSQVVPHKLKGQLKEAIQRLTIDQPSLQQLSPLAAAKAPGAPLSLDESTRELAARFAQTVGELQKAYVRKDELAVNRGVTEALGLMAEVYALSAANGGNRVQMGLWGSHLRGVGTGALALALLYQLNSLYQAEKYDNVGNMFAAILILLLVRNVWMSRGGGKRMVDVAGSPGLIESMLPSVHRAEIARANVEYFWSEVLSIVDQNDKYGTPEAILQYLAGITPEHNLERACEPLFLTAPKTPSSQP